ncbi:MAG TPA: replicative DNA helicase [Armatimonadota bacterium]
MADEANRNLNRPEAALPPQDLEAEQAALGSILVEPGAAMIAIGLLEEQDFYREAHRQIFRAMTAAQIRNEPVDLITVSAELRRREVLDSVGGVEYLEALIHTVPTAAHVSRYATLVAEKSVLRKLIRAGGDIQGLGYENPSDIGQVLDQAEQKIFEIAQRRTMSDFESIGPLAEQTFDKFTKMNRNPGFMSGIPTGLAELDKLTSGLQPGDLIIVAARPSMGKTSLAIANFALHAGVHANKGVGIFSLEMSKGQLAEMLLCAHARVNPWRLRQGSVGDREWGKIGRALTDLPHAPIFIDDTPAIPILELRSKARRLKAQHGIDMLIVDYLQLASAGAGYGGDNRHQEVSVIARSLKALARELHVPVVALSQLSRRVEQREDKRPILSDLAESGSIEAEADLVCFLFRPSYYERKKAMAEGDGKPAPRQTYDHPSKAEIIVAKHRNGPVGTVDTIFHPQYRTFFDVDQYREGDDF